MDPPIWMEVGYDADAITKLINQGMDLTQREPFFNKTVLHHWAGGHYFPNNTMDDGISSYQADSLEVVKLLIEKGADMLALDNWDFTPLLVAANGPFRSDLPNLKVLDFLLEREEYSRAEKIEAMELAGAVILKNTKNAPLFHKGFDYWRKTFHLRSLMEVDDSGFIEKPRLNLKITRITEWDTSAELEDVIERPDKFAIQSFLVRLRIFSSKKWGAINSLFESAFRVKFLWHHWNQVYTFVETIDILLVILETLLIHSDLTTDDAQWKIIRVVGNLIDVFTFLDRVFPDFWTEEIITTSLNLIVSATESNCPVLCYLIRIVRILSHLPQYLLTKDTMETLSKVRDQRGHNLLHKAINNYAALIDLESIRFLLIAGCDPNAIDEYGNSPLHFLAKLDERYYFNHLDIIADLLLDFGAQQNLKNADGKTAVDLWIEETERHRYYNEKLPIWCTELPTLTCLSGRVIRRYRIPYLKLPNSLISFIEKHKLT